MNGNLFADGVVVADYQAADFGVGAKIENLGLAADDAIGKEMITFSDSDVFINDDIGFEDGPFADDGAAADKAVRPDYDAVLYTVPRLQ